MGMGKQEYLPGVTIHLCLFIGKGSSKDQPPDAQCAALVFICRDPFFYRCWYVLYASWTDSQTFLRNSVASKFVIAMKGDFLGGCTVL